MDWGETLALLDHAVTIPEAVRAWGGDPGSATFVSEGVNVVYRFQAGAKGCYLRFTHDSLLSERRVASAVHYLRHLNEEEAPVCEPIPAQSGQFVLVFEHNGSRWLATVTGEAPGARIGLDCSDAEVFEAWGRSLGRLHRAAESYQPAPECEFAHWNDIWDGVRLGLHPQDSLAHQEFQRLERWQKRLPAQHPDFGLTHADYNPRNVVWDGQQVTALDFDEPSWGWYAGDIARALLEFMERPREQRTQFQEWFLRGYRSSRSFSDYWEENLPGFMQMRALDMYALSHRFGIPPGPEDSEGRRGADAFCERMQARFANPALWE